MQRKHQHVEHQSVDRPMTEALEARCLLSASLAASGHLELVSSPAPQSITPIQARTAAGIDSSITGDGSGQTIAIVAPFADANIAGDLKTFNQQFQIPDAPAFTVVSAAGSSNIAAADQTWSSEIALDVEWAHALAPGAKIVLVQAQSDQIGDLAAAVDTARKLPGVSVVSMSWGIDQYRNLSFDRIFATPASHIGVTFVAAASDSATSAFPWPAAVTTVVAAQSQWVPSYGLIANSFVPASITSIAYQSALTGGYAVYNSAGGGWQSIGGASALAPQWAGLVAIGNQARASLGLPTLDGGNSSLPAQFHNVGYEAAGGGAAYTLSFTQYVPSAPVRSVSTTSVPDPAPAPADDATKPDDDAPKPKPPQVPVTDPTARAAAIIYAQGRVADAKNVSVNFTISAGPSRIDLPQPGAEIAKLPEVQNAIDHSIAASRPLPEHTAPHHALMTVAAINPLEVIVRTAPLALVAVADGADAVAPLVYGAIPEAIPMLHHIGAATIHATFADTLAVFINESVVPARSTDATPSHSHRRAWVITASILAADALMLRIVLGRRQSKRAKSAAFKARLLFENPA